MKFVNIIRAILCVFLLQTCSQGLEAKSFFKKLVGIATSNPLRGVTKIVSGPNTLIPIDPRDVKEGVYGENFHTVQKGALYRSAQLSGEALDGYIKKYGIKTIINLRGAHSDQQWWLNEKTVADANHVALFNMPTSAATLTSKKNIAAILNVFDTAPRPILVHCRAGVDRTGEVAALWVLDQQKKSTADALGQLSVWHKHNALMYPAKDFLIKIWKGREWFTKEYDPKDYPQFPCDAVDEGARSVTQ